MRNEAGDLRRRVQDPAPTAVARKSNAMTSTPLRRAVPPERLSVSRCFAPSLRGMRRVAAVGCGGLLRSHGADERGPPVHHQRVGDWVPSGAPAGASAQAPAKGTKAKKRPRSTWRCVRCSFTETITAHRLASQRGKARTIDIRLPFLLCELRSPCVQLPRRLLADSSSQGVLSAAATDPLCAAGPAFREHSQIAPWLGSGGPAARRPARRASRRSQL